MERNIDKQKMKIIIVSASALVTIIAIIITVACLNMGKKPSGNDEDYDDGESIGAFADKTYTSSSSKNSSSSSSQSSSGPAFELVFESNGDGSCTIAGIGSFSGSELIIPAESADGETVTGIADGAFEGASQLTTVTIPATIKSIGSGVFVDCPSLCDITVNSANTKYCSVGGVLFTKDKTELICYPAAKVGKSYLLSTNVRKISDFAFDSIANLKSIYYESSASKYHSIEIGTGNQAFSALSVTCNYIPAK